MLSQLTRLRHADGCGTWIIHHCRRPARGGKMACDGVLIERRSGSSLSSALSPCTRVRLGRHTRTAGLRGLSRAQSAASHARCFNFQRPSSTVVMCTVKPTVRAWSDKTGTATKLRQQHMHSMARRLGGTGRWLCPLASWPYSITRVLTCDPRDLGVRDCHDLRQHATPSDSGRRTGVGARQLMNTTTLHLLARGTKTSTRRPDRATARPRGLAEPHLDFVSEQNATGCK